MQSMRKLRISNKIFSVLLSVVMFSLAVGGFAQKKAFAEANPFPPGTAYIAIECKDYYGNALPGMQFTAAYLLGSNRYSISTLFPVGHVYESDSDGLLYLPADVSFAGLGGSKIEIVLSQSYINNNLVELQSTIFGMSPVGTYTNPAQTVDLQVLSNKVWYIAYDYGVLNMHWGSGTSTNAPSSPFYDYFSLFDVPHEKAIKPADLELNKKVVAVDGVDTIVNIPVVSERQTVTYEFEITNLGEDKTSFVLTDDMPGNFSFDPLINPGWSEISPGVLQYKVTVAYDTGARNNVTGNPVSSSLNPIETEEGIIFLTLTLDDEEPHEDGIITNTANIVWELVMGTGYYDDDAKIRIDDVAVNTLNITKTAEGVDAETDEFEFEIYVVHSDDSTEEPTELPAALTNSVLNSESFDVDLTNLDKSAGNTGVWVRVIETPILDANDVEKYSTEYIGDMGETTSDSHGKDTGWMWYDYEEEGFIKNLLCINYVLEPIEIVKFDKKSGKTIEAVEFVMTEAFSTEIGTDLITDSEGKIILNVAGETELKPNTVYILEEQETAGYEPIDPIYFKTTSGGSGGIEWVKADEYGTEAHFNAFHENERTIYVFNEQKLGEIKVTKNVVGEQYELSQGKAIFLFKLDQLDSDGSLTGRSWVQEMVYDFDLVSDNEIVFNRLELGYSYKVTELETMRYKSKIVSPENGEIKLTKTNLSGEVAIENEKVEDRYFSSTSVKKNKFGYIPLDSPKNEIGTPIVHEIIVNRVDEFGEPQALATLSIANGGLAEVWKISGVTNDELLGLAQGTWTYNVDSSDEEDYSVLTRFENSDESKIYTITINGSIID